MLNSLQSFVPVHLQNTLPFFAPEIQIHIINYYKGKKIFKFIEALSSSQEICTIHDKKFKEFTLENCIKWFIKSGTKDNYRDVGVEMETQFGKYIFAMGINNIAFGRSDDFDFSKNKVSNRDEDIFVIIDKIKNKLTTK